jgi:1-acyl-sn-glycerol-3-phosphate acyltransferase
MAQVVQVVRSLVFYAVFYSGTLGYVLATYAASLVSERALRRVVRGWAMWHRRCARWLLGIRVEVSGPRPPAAALVALRHESFFEAIDLPILLGDPVIFAKAELLRIPLWGPIAQTYGLMPVERDKGAKAMRAMIAAARAQSASGRLYAIFPEGTRVAHGTAPPLQAGFAGLYKLLGLPVVPVALDSGPLYHRRWKRPGTIHIRFGELIPAGLPRDEIEPRVHAAMLALNGTPA